MLSARIFRKFCVALGVGGLCILPAIAQRAEVTDNAVTILTDQIIDDASRGSTAINQLARHLSAQGPVRLLPIAGKGGVENVRDLLYQRGVDFALVNSDVLRLLSLNGQLPDARRRVRYVSHLFDDKIYLLARNSVSDIEDLKGRRVATLGAYSASQTTAMTLFRLLKIDVTLHPIDRSSALDAASLAGIDAVLLVGQETRQLALSDRVLRDFQLRPILLRPELQDTYRSATLEPGDSSNGAATQRVETISVPVLLAVFDWTTAHARYPKIERFITSFLNSIVDLRRGNPGSSWFETDLLLRVGGWNRHALVDPERRLTAEQIALIRPRRAALDVGSPSEPRRPEPQHRAPADPTTRTDAATPIFTIAAVARPPLADPNRGDGGLILELLTRGLASQSPGSKLSIQWKPPGGSPVVIAPGQAPLDFLLPVETVDCERPNGLSAASAELCDLSVASAPLMNVVIGMFVLQSRRDELSATANLDGRRICLADDRDASDLDGDGRNWLREKKVVVVKKRTVLECLQVVQTGEADAVVANELEGRHLMKRLGLSGAFVMLERPLATRGLHVAVLKSHPNAEQLIKSLNDGIAQLRSGGAYARIIDQHLIALLGG